MTDNHIEIVPVQNLDQLEAVFQIDQSLFVHDYYVWPAWQEMFNNPYYEIVIVVYNQNIAGFLCLLANPDEIEIIRIGVASQYQGKHLGSALMDYANHQALTSHKNLLLEVSSQNPKAIHLYEKCGFQVIGKRKQYYSDQSDAIIMEKCLEI